MIQVTSQKQNNKFNLIKTLHCHELPLTNCAFNKNGDKFITGSYDQTCIIWDTDSGEILQKLKGHKKKSALAPSIKQRNYGMSKMANVLRHFEAITPKLSVWHSTPPRLRW